MDFDEYRIKGKEMIDYIADYLETIRTRKVYPDVKPGYLKNLIPSTAPVDGESWDSIFADVEKCIMPGITHWQSPHMHAYFPALNSFPSLLGDMLADAINCLGFTWASSPACTELEIIVMNWLAKIIGLPDQFMHTENNTSTGGGVIQTTASDSTLICLLAGRTEAIKRFKSLSDNDVEDTEINGRLVAYCSDQAHSSVEKACLIGLVKLRYIESDDDFCLRVDRLIEAIEDDKEKNLIPFYVCATLGTTGACSFDNLEEIGLICKKEHLWLHVDAAYAGSAFVCPEYRKWLRGISYANSFAFNPSKWLMVNFDCTAMWVQNCESLHSTFNVEPLYLKHENSGLGIDYMHWQIPLSKRFRSLKLWFVIRNYGISGLQRHIRKGVKYAELFESLMRKDPRFVIPVKRHLGMVAFCLKEGNYLTEKLLKRLNLRGNIHCVPAALKDKYVIRFTVTSQYTTNDDIINDWKEIKNTANNLLNEWNNIKNVEIPELRIPNFGTSLLLSNTPMSPKVVNASYAAIFDKDVLSPWKKWIAQLYNETVRSPSGVRPHTREMFKHGKQYSLDSQVSMVHKMFFKMNKSPISELLHSHHFDGDFNNAESDDDIQLSERK